MKSMKKPTLFTIGHSTRPLAEFLRLLEIYGIKTLVDIRTIPKSRHNPQFGEVQLKHSLHEANIRYMYLKALGGLRPVKKDSVNMGWRNKSFRGYADHMATKEFHEGLEVLMEIGKKENVAIMCAEALPWRCHRSLVGDALTKKGWVVQDIMSKTSAPKHKLTSFLKVREGQLIYPAPKIYSRNLNES
jgi:uncharacterized protein (DUF488 family)